MNFLHKSGRTYKILPKSIIYFFFVLCFRSLTHSQHLLTIRRILYRILVSIRSILSTIPQKSWTVVAQPLLIGRFDYQSKFIFWKRKFRKKNLPSFEEVFNLTLQKWRKNFVIEFQSIAMGPHEFFRKNSWDRFMKIFI